MFGVIPRVSFDFAFAQHAIRRVGQRMRIASIVHRKPVLGLVSEAPVEESTYA